MDDLQLALELIAGAASVALPYFGTQTRRWDKDDGSPVGEADLAVDHFLVSRLREARPDDGLLSEESGSVGPEGRRWIIDPIDGTVAFLAGLPHWGTHVALQQDGEVVLGVVSRPVLDRRWWAVRAGGAHTAPLGGGPASSVRVSEVSSLAMARATGWIVDAPPLARLSTEVTWQDCEYNDLLCVLDGRAEIQVVPGKVWDHAPFLVLLEEAGGALLDGQGGHRLDRGTALYTNGRVDAELMEMIPGW